MEQVLLSDEQSEILEYVDKSNNEIAESFSNKKSKQKGYKNTSEMYIAELYEMKDKLQSIAMVDWRSTDIIKERRAINNEIEKVVGIKKTNNAMYILNEIRAKGEALYLE